LQVSVGVDTLADGLLLIVFPLELLVSALDELIELLGSQFTRCDIARVLPECLAAHGPIEDLDGLEAEARADLDQRQLLDVVLLRELLLVLVHHLVHAEPHAVVVVVKTQHVVNERLRLRVVLRSVKRLMQHLLDQLEVGL